MLCLISAVQQSDSDIYRYIDIYSLPLWFITGVQCSPLCYTVGPFSLCINSFHPQNNLRDWYYLNEETAAQRG